MFPFDANEARALIEWATNNLQRAGGLGDLVLQIQTADSTISGYVVERDGESSMEGILLGGMSPESQHSAVRWDEIVWLGLGYAE